MANKCLNCSVEVVSKGKKPAKYCSDACRKSYKRTQEADKTTNGHEQTVAQDTLQSTNGQAAIQSHPESIVPIMTPEGLAVKVPANYGLSDCTCRHCKQAKTNKSSAVINHGPYKPASELGPNEINRVSLPGDIDYVKPVKTELGQLSASTIADIARINARCEDSDKDKLKQRTQRAIDYQSYITQTRPLPEGITANV